MLLEVGEQAGQRVPVGAPIACGSLRSTRPATTTTQGAGDHGSQSVALPAAGAGAPPCGVQPAAGAGLLGLVGNPTDTPVARANWRICVDRPDVPRAYQPGILLGMAVQIAVRLSDEVLAGVDAAVADGAFPSRAAAVRAGLERILREQREREIQESYRRASLAHPDADTIGQAGLELGATVLAAEDARAAAGHE